MATKPYYLLLVVAAATACSQDPAFHEVQLASQHSDEATAGIAYDEYLKRQEDRKINAAVIVPGAIHNLPPSGSKGSHGNNPDDLDSTVGGIDETPIDLPSDPENDVPPPIFMPSPVKTSVPSPAPTAVPPVVIVSPTPGVENPAPQEPGPQDPLPIAGTPTPNPTPVVVVPTPTAFPPVAGTPTPPPVSDVCAERNKTHKILIIDLKSGWFAGDGGTAFKTFTDTQCNQTMQIAYVHITTKKIESNLSTITGGSELFPCLNGSNGKVFQTEQERTACNVLGSFHSYDEFWLLSGSQYDSEDVVPWGQLFTNIRARARELAQNKPNAGFFFGAGLSNIDHANVLAHDLFPTVFTASTFGESQDTIRGTFPNQKFPEFYGTKNLTPGNGNTRGTFAQSWPGFQGLTKIFDYPKSTSRYDIGECFTDPILNTSVTKLATDLCGNVAAATTQVGNHKIYLEGNMARFYGTTPVEYFNRIAIQLLPQ